MLESEYRSLYESLKRYSDVQRLARETGLDEELLMVIYTQRVTRDATKRYYVVKKHVDQMSWRWRNGTPLIKLADQNGFPPVLIALMVLTSCGYTRKQIWAWIRNPDGLENKRLRREITEVAVNDHAYSPAGMERQYARGRWGEEKLQKWLDDQGIEYRTEKQLKGEFAKTPDCLLRNPIKLGNEQIFWIESKASYGDPVELRRNIHRQLVPYTQLFGPGIVVYWFGFADGATAPEGIYVRDAKFFEKPLPKS
ncbi:MAG: TPD domain-containing protein [Euryarchaeota archaeon]|nr:TPD domain-containing protein [Euryarchaeota archaeon]